MSRMQRPKTTRVYLHPPRSERIFTLWREGKLVFGEIEAPITDYSAQTSAGVWITDLNGDSLDFRSASYELFPDGTPIHRLKNTVGELDITLESFATPERRAVSYTKILLKNNTDHAVAGGIKMLVRTASEQLLINGSPDLYCPYSPDVAEWHSLPATWHPADLGISDGRRFLRIFSSPYLFDEERAEIEFSANYLPGEERELTLVYHIADDPSLDYSRERERTVLFWRDALSSVRSATAKMPFEYIRMAENLTVQMLQCFAYTVGSDSLILRQGGLQRQIWTFEAMPVLEALTRIGGYDSYVRDTLDTYFTDFYTPTGEIKPLGISWAMISGTALYSFAHYARHTDRAFFDKYIDRAKGTFDWIRRTRASTIASDGILPGIFPPLSSCDDPLAFQSWCNTDTFNLRGLCELCKTLEFFGDADAAAAVSEYRDYLHKMREYWQNISDAEPDDEVEMRLSPTLPNAALQRRFAFSPAYCYMIDALDMDVDEARRIIRYYARRGNVRGGLYNRMPHKNKTPASRYNLDGEGVCRVWYVCCHEFYLFRYFMRHGIFDKCREILDDSIRYAMTDEYYMQERYHELDVWFSPWSPNASAAGRVINMILDIYK